MSLQQTIDNKLNQVEHDISQSTSIMEFPILLARILEIDDTLYCFRDLAGSYLKNGDGYLMARYRNRKDRLLNLAYLCENKYSMPILSQLKCNS